MTAMAGVVYLVGAGPGDPGLITVRGLDLLESADVVVHDRLVDGQILRRARTDAEIVDAGKMPGGRGARQGDIDSLLIARAAEGRSVVRLKGGDPFVFGRRRRGGHGPVEGRRTLRGGAGHHVRHSRTGLRGASP